MAIEKVKYKVSKVLPLVYDDTLSYYEVLCKLISKVNECIDSCNENASDITLLQTVVSGYDDAISTLQTKVSSLELSSSSHASEIGILQVKVAALEAAVAAIPTYTAGRGIAITNGAVSVMGNDIPLDIHNWFDDWSTGGETTITDESAIAWMLNGGALRNADGVILELVNIGNVYCTYVGTLAGVSYRLRYNKNNGTTTLAIIT